MMDRFSSNINHVPDKELHKADTLSREDQLPQDVVTLQELAEICMVSTVSHLPAIEDTSENSRRSLRHSEMPPQS